MRKVWEFLIRDLVNTIVLLLTVVFLIASIVKGNDLGLFYGILVLFITRFMSWHYALWDKINASVTDDEIRVNIFGLPRKSSNIRAKEDGPIIFVIIGWLIALGGVFLFGYLVVTLIFQ